MTQYTGLAVGGPRDGQWITASSPVFRAPQTLRSVLNFELMDELAPVSVSVVEYRHYVGVYAAGSSVDFWIPSDKDFSWAIEHLIQDYMRRRRA